MRLTLQRALIVVACFAAAFVFGLATASAADRHCQTVLTCNFKPGGSYRGCLSSYSCRQCRFVTASCTIGNAKGTCRKIKCGWGA
jgi:hypothetical protein